MTDELLTTDEAAALVKLSEKWFRQARWTGSGPPYMKIGRAVRYEKAVLLDWFRQHYVH